MKTRTSRNLDPHTVHGFGKEWSRFRQTTLSQDELNRLFQNYFSIFPWNKLPEKAIGFDMGCGSGRWALLVAERVGKLYCIDASEEALFIAKENLKNVENAAFLNETTDTCSLKKESMDFGYSLGVLHHIPDTQSALNDCTDKLKRGAPFLLYLYYALDNKPIWFRLIWMASDLVRKVVSSLPEIVRFYLSQVFALFVYLPLARLSKVLQAIGFNTLNLPLSSYKDCSFYTMRTDALDRFGTKLEQRFTKEEIYKMMLKAGLVDISFRETAPYWVSIGFKA